MKAVDLTGKIFGKLYVVERAKSLDNKHAYWRCRCDCGNEKIIRGSNLTSNMSHSCGCIIVEKNRKDKKSAEFIEKSNHARGVHDGTAECLLNSKLRIDNTSGVRGVYIKKNGKYVAQICYKKKVIYIGTFDTLELAKFARKVAEKKIWGKDLE